MSLNNKEKIIKLSNEKFKNSTSVILANFRGLNSNIINKIRKICRASTIDVCIVRNTLLRKSIKKTKFECLKNNFIGPTLIAYSYEYGGVAARIFKKFEKKYANFKITAASFEKKLILPENINLLANQFTYKEAIKKFVTIIKYGTIGKLINVFYAIHNNKKNN